jgi:hypothetical protein
VSTEILLVTCCLEKSRHDVLEKVVRNLLVDCPPEWSHQMTVFDNASTYPGTQELLKGFSNVYRADHNVGYWTAIDWWLGRLAGDSNRAPDYAYVIESDMVHHYADGLKRAEGFLDRHPDLGAVRLHEYSIRDMHLYDKDRPTELSRSSLWQSHTNKATGQAVRHVQAEDDFWRTNFLTQLPALNRFAALEKCFDSLRAAGQFTELDFQRLYHQQYPEIALLDGGIFSCNLNPHGAPGVTGSWTGAGELKRLGYKPTRVASIVPRGEYTVERLV